MLETVRKSHPRLAQPKVMELNKDVPTPREVQVSFVKLRELCAPENVRQFWIQDSHFLSLLEVSRWLHNVSVCLAKAKEASMGLHNEFTVVLQEGDGYDMCCVVASLSQMLIDPYFRSIVGFQSLVQKEWVALGHPFCTRLGHVYNIETQELPANETHQFWLSDISVETEKFIEKRLNINFLMKLRRTSGNISQVHLTISHRYIWQYLTGTSDYISQVHLTISHRYIWLYLTGTSDYISQVHLTIYHKYIWQYLTGTSDYISQVHLAISHRYIWQYLTGTSDYISQVHLTISHRYIWQYLTGTSDYISQVHLTISHRYIWQYLTGTSDYISQVHLTISHRYIWQYLTGTSDYISQVHLTISHRYIWQYLTGTSDYISQAPVFLLFLDCVWQLLQQFPADFQMTETYLTTLWDSAHVSIFETFLFDCERDRKLAKSEPNNPLTMRSAWDWGEQFSDRDVSLFYNPLYCPPATSTTPQLLPPPLPVETGISALQVWSQCYFRFIPSMEIIGGGKPQHNQNYPLPPCTLARCSRMQAVWVLSVEEIADLQRPARKYMSGEKYRVDSNSGNGNDEVPPRFISVTKGL
ncbi:Belongs to the protein-tyrosine phosphatase [Homalodisca vitripennis]|nr:Belongs to the protein-tyrosine phosphatase [Homalodisca vitripennis]